VGAVVERDGPVALGPGHRVACRGGRFRRVVDRVDRHRDRRGLGHAARGGHRVGEAVAAVEVRVGSVGDEVVGRVAGRAVVVDRLGAVGGGPDRGDRPVTVLEAVVGEQVEDVVDTVFVYADAVVDNVGDGIDR